jgi:putative sigma-54 modulation protein
MQVSVTARKLDMTPALKSYVEQKVLRITKHLERVIDAHVVLSVEKYRHKVEVTVNANGVILRGEEVTDDMYSSIDQVMDKLDAQVKKYKSKLNKRGRQKRAERAVPELEEFSDEDLEYLNEEESELTEGQAL